jgi:hypothetical protein
MADPTTKYCTVQELRTQITREGSKGSAGDVALTVIINGVEGLIDAVCNRPDGFVAASSATARYFSGSGKPWQRIDECVEISAVAVKDAATDTTYTAWDSPTTNMSGDGDWFAFRGSARTPEYSPLSLAQPKPYDNLMVDINGDGGYSIFTNGEFRSRGGFRPTTEISRGLPTVQVTSKWGYAVTVPPIVKQVTIIQAARWFKKGESSHADLTTSVEFGQLSLATELDSDLVKMLKVARLARPAIGGK